MIIITTRGLLFNHFIISAYNRPYGRSHIWVEPPVSSLKTYCLICMKSLPNIFLQQMGPFVCFQCEEFVLNLCYHMVSGLRSDSQSWDYIFLGSLEILFAIIIFRHKYCSFDMTKCVLFVVMVANGQTTICQVSIQHCNIEI